MAVMKRPIQSRKAKRAAVNDLLKQYHTNRPAPPTAPPQPFKVRTAPVTPKGVPSLLIRLKSRWDTQCAHCGQSIKVDDPIGWDPTSRGRVYCAPCSPNAQAPSSGSPTGSSANGPTTAGKTTATGRTTTQQSPPKPTYDGVNRVDPARLQAFVNFPNPNGMGTPVFRNPVNNYYFNAQGYRINTINDVDATDPTLLTDNSYSAAWIGDSWVFQHRRSALWFYAYGKRFISPIAPSQICDRSKVPTGVSWPPRYGVDWRSPSAISGYAQKTAKSPDGSFCYLVNDLWFHGVTGFAVKIKLAPDAPKISAVISVEDMAALLAIEAAIIARAKKKISPELQAAFDKYNKLKARALHPDTPGPESLVALRMALIRTIELLFG